MIRTTAYIHLFLLILFLTACSTNRPDVDVNRGIDVVQVDEKLGPKNLLNIVEYQKESNGLIGPQFNENIPKKHVAIFERSPVISLIFGPGLYRVLAHISFLKILVNEKIKVNIVSGSGMGTLIAALYAKGHSPARIEWFFFKFLNKCKNLKLYSKKWFHVLKKLLIEEFNEENIEDLRLSLVIPLFDKKNNKIIYMRKGLLVPSLYLSLQPPDGSAHFNYSSSFQHEVFNKEKMNKLGADIVIGVDVLGNEMELADSKLYLSNIFSKAIERVKEEKEGLDLFFSLPLGNIPFDSFIKITDFLSTDVMNKNKYLPQILEKINDWKNRSNQKR